MGWALWQSRAEAKVPGNDFATLTIPAFLFLGLIGVALGMGFAVAGYFRGEASALRALWLIPVLTVAAPVFAVICAIL